VLTLRNALWLSAIPALAAHADAQAFEFYGCWLAGHFAESRLSHPVIVPSISCRRG
jgi:hypothetical protein